ncbi:putative transporter [bioreactor metagenome]|uniref:Putative transporter n=2 Tax=root TaxID=1 RepID=A0A645EH18_9ZZZZ
MPSEPLFWALALGACLGGNGSFLGAAANVVVADVANRFGYPITFKAFMKTGMLSVFIAMILCSIYLVIRYRAFL